MATTTAPAREQRVAAPTARSTPKRRNLGPMWGLIAWAVGLLFVAPVLWMLLTSLHSEADAATNPPSIAAKLTLSGYRSFFDSDPWPALIRVRVRELDGA